MDVSAYNTMRRGYLDFHRGRPEMSLERAAEVVSSNFGSLDNFAALHTEPDGLVGYGDLAATARDQSVSPELRLAAVILTQTPGAFGLLDSASGLAEPDGLVGQADIQAFRANLRSLEPSHPWSSEPPRSSSSGPYRPREGRPSTRAESSPTSRQGRTTLRSNGTVDTHLGNGSSIRSDGTTGQTFGTQTIRSNGEVETRLGNVTISSRGTVTFDF